MNRPLHSLPLVIGALLFTPVWAAGAAAVPVGHRSAASTFNELDTDGDGTLSPDEAATSSPLSSHFPIADVNEDGRIDEAEFSAFEALVDTIPSPPGESI